MSPRVTSTLRWRSPRLSSASTRCRGAQWQSDALHSAVVGDEPPQSGNGSGLLPRTILAHHVANGQCDVESRASINVIFGPEPASMHLDNGPANRQAQTESLGF